MGSHGNQAEGFVRLILPRNLYNPFYLERRIEFVQSSCMSSPHRQQITMPCLENQHCHPIEKENNRHTKRRQQSAFHWSVITLPNDSRKKKRKKVVDLVLVLKTSLPTSQPPGKQILPRIFGPSLLSFVCFSCYRGPSSVTRHPSSVSVIPRDGPDRI